MVTLRSVNLDAASEKSGHMDLDTICSPADKCKVEICSASDLSANGGNKDDG